MYDLNNAGSWIELCLHRKHGRLQSNAPFNKEFGSMSFFPSSPPLQTHTQHTKKSELWNSWRCDFWQFGKYKSTSNFFLKARHWCQNQFKILLFCLRSQLTKWWAQKNLTSSRSPWLSLTGASLPTEMLKCHLYPKGRVDKKEISAAKFQICESHFLLWNLKYP